MQETILSLQDVSYSYQTKAQTVHAVREVRYSFETGRFYAIMGRSGSGKTTLLSLMAGLELPDSGQVCYRETPTRCCACPTAKSWNQPAKPDKPHFGRLRGRVDEDIDPYRVQPKFPPHP